MADALIGLNDIEPDLVVRYQTIGWVTSIDLP
jgi:hypothetical protein